jgi:Predicted transcriptional regulators
MFLTVDTEDPRPLYQQVVDGIKHLIAQGRLSEGVVLPSTRQLASDLGVNLNTIATAYRELQNQGLVTIKHGAGCVITSGRQRKRKRSPVGAAAARSNC